MLMGGPNYIMIRREIFGKVHGRGVKEFWLISQFPAKHKGVASDLKIVFAASGLARLLGYCYGVINNEFIIYIAIAYSPQSDCVSLFRDPSVTVCPWCNTGGEVSPQAESWKTPTLEPLRSKHSWLSEKKEGAFKNTKIKCHFKFYFVTDRKLLWIRPNESSLKEGEGGGLVVLNSSSLLENKKLQKNTGRTAEYMQEWERK